MIEKAESNYAAYLPQLLGCSLTSTAVAQFEQNIREAAELHIAELREDGQPLPMPSSAGQHVEIFAWVAVTFSRREFGGLPTLLGLIGVD